MTMKIKSQTHRPFEPSTPAASTVWRRVRSTLLAAAGLLALPTFAADTLYLLTANGELSTALVTNATAFTAPVAITGVTAGETLVAIDVRPQNQRLYALGVNATNNTATLYCISIETNLATRVGTAAGSIAFTTDGVTAVDFPDPATTDWDIDFNPAVDRLRVVAGSLNFRVNPNTGAPVDTDANGANGINPDGAINGGTTTVSGAGYTNNFPDTDANAGNNVTTLYAVDAATDSVYLQNPPNAGTATTVASFTSVFDNSAVDVSRVRGFDIQPQWVAPSNNAPVDPIGVGYMIAEVGGSTFCYGVNLLNGKLQQLDGAIPLGVRSLAVRTSFGAALALNKDGTQLNRFTVTSPGTLSNASVTGINAGETLVAIDARPATGQLFALGVNATADNGTLYILDPQLGTLTAVGTPGQISFVDGTGAAVDLPDATTGYGMDFNPTVDRVRVVTGSGLNFRVNPITGASVDGDNGGTAGSVSGVNPDGTLNSGATKASATAYTNNFGGATATTQYAFDSSTGNLYIQNPPNNGTLTYVGNVPNSVFDFSGVSGFDIPSNVAVGTSGNTASGFGWILSGRSGGSNTILYRVDLATGSGQTIGLYGSEQASGLVVWATAPNIAVEGPAGFLADGGTVEFGTTGAPVLSRTFTIYNRGSQAMTYTTQAPSGTAFAITSGATGSIPGGGSTTLTIGYTPTAAQENESFYINSNDPDTVAFGVNLSGPGYLPLADDEANSTTGETRLQVLPNDPIDGTLTILSVSDANITISGRTLVIPEGYVGTFTYDVSNGTLTGRATVTVNAGTPAVAPLAFNGILTDATGKVAGWASVALTTKGVATTKLIVGTSKATKKLTFPTGGNTISGTVKFGTPAADATLDLDRATAGVVKLTFTDAGSAAFTGTLHAAAAPIAAAIKHHIAMASIDPTITGGAHAALTVSKKNAGKIVGVLPDGHPISAASVVTDHGKFAFFAVDKKSKPAATYGGEFTFANLTTTDLTGELVWVKPGQLPTVKGLHLLGENTTLIAIGCLYDGLTPFAAGSRPLDLVGGNLAANETNTVAVAATGIPAVPTGSLVAWTGVKQKFGKFSAKVTVPTLTKPVSGKGLYLPKAGIAWGFFPGTTVGGRIRLVLP